MADRLAAVGHRAGARRPDAVREPRRPRRRRPRRHAHARRVRRADGRADRLAPRQASSRATRARWWSRTTAAGCTRSATPGGGARQQPHRVRHHDRRAHAAEHAARRGLLHRRCAVAGRPHHVRALRDRGPGVRRGAVRHRGRRCRDRRRALEPRDVPGRARDPADAGRPERVRRRQLHVLGGRGGTEARADRRRHGRDLVMAPRLHFGGQRRRAGDLA